MSATAQTKGSHGYRTCIWTRARVSITLIRKGAPISAHHTRAKRSLRRGVHTRIYTCQLWGGRTCPTCVTCHLCGMDPCHGMHRCRRRCTNPWGVAHSHACTRESKLSDLGHPYPTNGQRVLHACYIRLFACSGLFPLHASTTHVATYVTTILSMAITCM